MAVDTVKEDAELGEEVTILEPKSSRGWLALIAHAEKVFEPYQQKCDSIDRLYANLDKLASTVREREFALFYANIQVIGPSIYSRPPVPVVTPKFKDRRPVARTAAEVLERCSIVTLDEQNIDGVMLGLRDDLTVIGRGVPWETLIDDEVHIEHVDRRDFLHDPARRWAEVDWVSKRSWLTRGEARKRFLKTSGKAYQNAAYTQRKPDEDGYSEPDTKMKAPIWELWSKSQNLVVWVSEGVDKVLDEGPPHLKLKDFFPCPEPAYGTLQRGTLIPVPDVLFYKDQLEEINEITGRIGALTESLRLKGFYPAGAGNLSDAIEAAMKNVNNNQTLIPVSDWTMLGTGNPKDIIVWVPLDQVAVVIKELIANRKQLIDDVYQITGLSDIQRGSVDPNEKLGQSELKAQFGAVRVKDKQGVLVRVARDITRSAAEIIAENYSQKTIMEMSQMELPTTTQITQQIQQLQIQGQQIEVQIAQAKQNPQIMAMAQQDPEKAQALEQQAQEQLQAISGQIEELGKTVTQDQVMKFLRDNKMRCFTLDIETDSTIQPDEDAAKQRATEFVTAAGGLIQQGSAAIAENPSVAPLFGQIFEYATKQFRVGRTMETTIEEFVDQMKQMAKQPRPDPAAAQQAAEQQKMQGEMQLKQQQMAMEGEAQKAKQADESQASQIKASAEGEAIKAKSAVEAKALVDKTAADLAIKKADLNAVKEKAALEAQHLEQQHKYKMETLVMERQASVQAAKEREQAHEHMMEKTEMASQANLELNKEKRAAIHKNGAGE